MCVVVSAFTYGDTPTHPGRLSTEASLSLLRVFLLKLLALLALLPGLLCVGVVSSARRSEDAWLVKLPNDPCFTGMRDLGASGVAVDSASAEGVSFDSLSVADMTMTSKLFLGGRVRASEGALLCCTAALFKTRSGGG